MTTERPIDPPEPPSLDGEKFTIPYIPEDTLPGYLSRFCLWGVDFEFREDVAILQDIDSIQQENADDVDPATLTEQAVKLLFWDDDKLPFRDWIEEYAQDWWEKNK